jgi:hypothetical protein
MSKVHSVAVVRGDKSTPANLKIETWGFSTRSGLRSPSNYKWEDFSEFSIEGPEQIQKRVTVTRLLAIGIFAFAKKKSSGESYLYADLKDGSNLIIKFNKKSVPEVKALFAPYKKSLPVENSSNSSSGNDIVSQLEKLEALHKKGSISEKEFKDLKNKLIQS